MLIFHLTCQRTTVLNADVPNCYITLYILVCSKLYNNNNNNNQDNVYGAVIVLRALREFTRFI